MSLPRGSTSAVEQRQSIFRMSNGESIVCAADPTFALFKGAIQNPWQPGEIGPGSHLFRAIGQSCLRVNGIDVNLSQDGRVIGLDRSNGESSHAEGGSREDRLVLQAALNPRSKYQTKHRFTKRCKRGKICEAVLL